MYSTPNQQQSKIAELEALLTKNPTAALSLPSFAGYLQACEYQLILFMVKENAWQGPVPPTPPNFKPNEGGIEFGLFLYWFNNPAVIDSFEIGLTAIALDVLLKLPKSQIDSTNYSFLVKNELIYVDGTVLSTETYATFDQGWFAAFLNLLETVIRGTWYNNGVFPMPTTPKPIQLSGTKAGTVKIAMVGDWGSGDAASAAVMNQIVSLKPDYIIHLGDVYYGGTPTAADPNSSHLFDLNEEMDNLVNAWPASYAGKSFTLNSNHEMYSGANGLFYDALNPATSPFSAQQGMSCFQLQFGGWNIVGLDSAFNGTSLDAFMSGNLGLPGDPQLKWLSSLNLNPAQTIVLTHHTGFEYDASEIDQLWLQLRAVWSGKDPYAWYWGHAHNGIVYSNPVKIPYNNPLFTTNTYARCAGHGALPYGLSTALQNNQNVLWQAASPMPAPSKQAYNGFVMLTLESTANQLSKITENFYDGSAPTTPTWTKVIFGS